MPATIRAPMKNPRLVANPWRRNPSVLPAREMRIMGRRPTRSERAPEMGMEIICAPP
jgi:hypothetical protein